MADNGRYVVKHPQGWAVKEGGNPSPESVHRRQGDAERSAKDTVRDLGGGEVRIQDRQGRWRDSDTVPPGNDPFPPRDRRR